MSLYSTLYDEIEFSIERIWRFLPPRYKSQEGGGGQTLSDRLDFWFVLSGHVMDELV